MAILKKLNAGECLESVQEPSRSPGWPILTPTAGVEIKALLTELGELPPNENDRLIDTRSEIPGETLGILVSTHPNVMAAFAANDAFQQAEASGRHIRTKIVTLKGRLDVGQPGPAGASGRKQINQSTARRPGIRPTCTEGMGFKGVAKYDPLDRKTARSLNRH